MRFIKAIDIKSAMKIPINIPILGKEELNEVTSILRDGVLTSAANIGGKNVQEFEKLASTFVKSKYAVAVNSGTAALQAALYVHDLKAGDEVLLPSFTFVATANAVISVGAKPVFVDILKENYTMDPNDLKKKITKKSKVIIPVHLYGNVAYMDQIIEIAKKNGLKIIEDAAQSLGSTYRGKHTGTFSELGCYSLYPAKVMTAGEGGFIVTNSKKLFDKLPSFLIKRRKNARILSELISDLDIKIPKERKNEKVNWYLYTIETNNREQVLKKLNSKGIGAAAYYPIPVHKTPFYNKKVKLPSTDWAASHVLSLPIHPLVSPKNIEFIAKTVRESLTR